MHTRHLVPKSNSKMLYQQTTDFQNCNHTSDYLLYLLESEAFMEDLITGVGQLEETSSRAISPSI